MWWSRRSNKSFSSVETPTYLVHFFLNQADKGSVLYSVDKCFETGAHPRNFCDKQNFKYLDAIIVGILPRDLVRDFRV